MRSMTDTRHQCSVCSRSYKRPEHLRRHQESHDVGRVHACQLCGTAFHRSDVLKRHLQTCRDRKAQAAGKRRACDRCAHQRKACDTGKPCASCAARNEPCSYRASEEGEGEAPPPPPPQHPSGLAVQEDSVPENGSSDHTQHAMPEVADVVIDDVVIDLPTSSFDFALSPDLMDYSTLIDMFAVGTSDGHDIHHEHSPFSATTSRRLSFLDRFTSRTGFVSSFDCGTLKQRQDVLSAFTAGQPESFPDAINFSDQSAATFPHPVDTAADSLVWRTHEILLVAKETITIKPRNSIVELTWSAVVEKLCSQFFSPGNIRKYLELFWSIWHPNVNFVHRPTFNPAKCKITLLVSMVLIGACVSPELLDQEHASMWFNVVEEMVFTDPDLNSDLSLTENTRFDHVRDHKHIQSLQAAYNVCLYQNWEGTHASRRRIRRYRFSTLVSAARDIGIHNARHHSTYTNQGHAFQWLRFVAEEELIRVFLWIFLLDTAFVIFNNLPPRMLIKEARMHMACPEACFQAETANECYLQLQLVYGETGLAPQVLLRTAVESLCNGDMSPVYMDTFANLGPLNLFVLTSALHYLIFQHQNSFASDLELGPLRNALCAWEEIWRIYTEYFSHSPPHVMAAEETVSTTTMWQRVGFMCHADEYWLLAKLMTDRILSGKSKLLTSRDARDDSTLIQGFESVQDEVLVEYDQTSMRQVNDLITALEDVQL